jgi:hypothetical protein
MVAAMDIEGRKEEAVHTLVVEITTEAANRMVAGTLMDPETIVAADRMEAATTDGAKG